MPGPFYFAWCDEATPFDTAMLRYDEVIFTYEIEQIEGNFASLKIDIINPYIGLMSVGRNLWCWFSWDNGSEVKKLFHGRLVGHASNFPAETVTLEFVARPSDFNQRKATLANTLKTLPYYDPLFIDPESETADSVLEARTQLYHTDRTTFDLTVSDIAVGEDGNLDVSNHFYDSLQPGFNQGPQRRISFVATVNWTQKAQGELDLTHELCAAAQASGSPTIYPIISSLTGDGMAKSWPKAGASVGEGWSISANASLTPMDWITPPIQAFSYTKPVYTDITVIPDHPSPLDGQMVYATGKGWQFIHASKDTKGKILSGYDTYILMAPLDMYVAKFILSYSTERKRSEVISFSIEADVQSLLVDPGDIEETTMQLSSDRADQPIDPGGAMPIGDIRSNTYFIADRGKQSFEYIVRLGIAKLVAAARAVTLTYQIPWQDAIDISCRWNSTIHDPRLGSGVAAGKIMRYKISGGENQWFSEIQIGCMIGYGNALTETAGDPVYAAPGYMASGYQQIVGGNTKISNSNGAELLYSGLDDISVIDDDRSDLFNVTASNFLVSLTCTNGPDQQRTLIMNTMQTDAFEPPTAVSGGHVTILYGDVGDGSQFEPSTTLTNNPTKFRMELKPLSNKSFVTNLLPTLSTLTIPKTIDLEASV